MKTIYGSLVGPMLARRDRKWVLAMVVPLLWACASTGGTVTTSVAPLRCEEPSLVVLPETPARQQRGDITVVAAADLPQCELATRVTFTPRGASMREMIELAVDDSRVPMTRAEQPQYMLSTADEFAMILSVTNGSDRVFRADNSVWAVSIDGSLVPSESEAGLASLIVLPGQTRQFRIPGISLNREWQGGVYAFQLYDVPTARDEAGSVTSRDNFEWYYTLSYQTLETPPAENKTCNVLVDGRVDSYVFREGETDPYAACP